MFIVKSAKADITNYIDQLKLSVVIIKESLLHGKNTTRIYHKLQYCQGICTWKSTTVFLNSLQNQYQLRVPLKRNLICFFNLWVKGDKITQDFMLNVMLADLTIS